MLLQHFKFKVQLLSAHHGVQIEIPELASEAKRRPTLIQIDDKLQTQSAPEIRQRNVSPNRFQLHISIEREELTLFDKTVERITVEMIAVGRVRRPIGIRVGARSHCQ